MAKQLRPDYNYDVDRQIYVKKIKNENGNYIKIYGKTIKELRVKVKARQAQIEQALISVGDPFVYEYAKTWFSSWAPGRKYKDVEAIRSAINNHICPAIGSMRVSEVTEDDLEDLLSLTADKSKSLNQKILRAVKAIFRSATKSGIISDNPASDLKACGQATAEKTALTDDQRKTLLSAVAGTTIELYVYLSLNTGLRREEALALKWDSIHLTAAHPYLEVRRALHWEHNQPIILDDLKSPAAKRKIPLSPALVDALRAAKAAGGDYVFGGEKPWTHQGFKCRWNAITVRSVGEKTITDKDGNKTVAKRNLGDKIKNHNVFVTIDFPVTPHILRHTYITNLILGGVNIKTVQYLAGHASVTITLNIYTHLMQNRPEDISDSVLAALPS